jgi:hypothetical protein
MNRQYILPHADQPQRNRERKDPAGLLHRIVRGHTHKRSSGRLRHSWPDEDLQPEDILQAREQHLRSQTIEGRH